LPEIYAKVLDLLENNEIRALVDKNETIGKKIRELKCKTVYADCRRGRREQR
jgi:threonyl-tRNA synthetase